MTKETESYDNLLTALLMTEQAPEQPGSTFVPQLTRAWPVNDLAAFQAELYEWLSDSLDTSITVREWWARLARAGLTMPTWPRSYGGISAPTSVQQLIEREFASLGLIGPPVGGVGLRQVGPALRQHATLDQCTRLLQPLMRGEQTWCILMNEHDADLSDAETTAVDDGASFVLNGGKLWTPEAPDAERALVLARTDRTAHVRRAMTCFVVDMKQEGISMTAEDTRPRLVRLDAVRARKDDVIGGVGSGWAVAQTIVAHAQTSLAGRIRRGVIDVEPGVAAGNLDRTMAEVLAAHTPRSLRSERRDEPGSDRRHSPDFT
jgi:alkylation response protein AidB-like acyl-CoA dehydrogenase